MAKVRLIAMAISRHGSAPQMLADGLVGGRWTASALPDGAPDSEKNELALAVLPPAPRQRRIRVRHGGRLEVYHREYQDNEVLVCLDETQATGAGDPYAPPAAARGTHGPITNTSETG